MAEETADARTRRTLLATLIALPAALAATLLLVSGPGSATATKPAAEARAAPSLDRTLTRAARQTRAAGATAAVYRDGRLVWTGATGRARGGRNARMRPDALFPIASTTKTVTTAIALALSDAGRLNLNQPIAAALPDLPGARRITPRMLMNHSSGLSDYFADGALDRQMRRDPYRPWTRSQVLDHVKRLKFRPGSRHSYSNSGLVALGGVIEHASGLTLEDAFQRYVAGPIGLTDSSFRYDALSQRRFAHPIEQRRRGGVRDKFGRRGAIPTDYWGEAWTDGGLATTAAGLALIGNAIFAGELLRPATVASMLPGPRGGYGLGTFERRHRGRSWLGHDGSYGGYDTENWTHPETGITVVAMTNTIGGGRAAPRIWRKLATSYLRAQRPR